MRKQKRRESTEANLIHRLVEAGYESCNCAIVALCGKVRITCTCEPEVKEEPPPEVAETPKRRKVKLPSDDY